MKTRFNITQNCSNIMELIIKNDCQLYTEKQTKTTKTIFKEFYDHFVDAEEFLKTIANLENLKEKQAADTANRLLKAKILLVEEEVNFLVKTLAVVKNVKG